MAEHNDIGVLGEELAIAYLRKKKYQIINTNWRFGKDEIDIIAKYNNQIIFVEVKTRQSNYFGEPEIFVNKTKQRFMVRAAQVYIEKNDIDEEARFDIIGILLIKGQPTINHIEDAFYPTL